MSELFFCPFLPEYGRMTTRFLDEHESVQGGERDTQYRSRRDSYRPSLASTATVLLYWLLRAQSGRAAAHKIGSDVGGRPPTTPSDPKGSEPRSRQRPTSTGRVRAWFLRR